LYNGGETDGTYAGRKGGKGGPQPKLSKWLGDVRKLFPPGIVQVLQMDAVERKGYQSLLLEPETLANVTPDIHMASLILELKDMVPEKSKDQARALVQAVVKQIRSRIEDSMERAVTGALNKRQHSPIPSLSGLDVKRTIRKNLGNYDRKRKQLIPQHVYFFDRQRRTKEWTVVLDIDQSGSMSESILYASVMGAIFASMPALDTHVVAFDTEVVDLTEAARADPVDVLYGIQLGGGTDINKSVAYCRQFVTNPRKT
jgi:hypothetical protein